MRIRMLFLVFCLSLCADFWGGFAAAESPSCIYCGMHRSKLEHSWVIITHDDGSSSSVCSIHCAVVDMALHTDKTILKITAGDYDRKRQIDADTAHWVIGGDIMGVMTAQAKWAFETKDSADKFLKGHGGRLADFQEVVKAAFEDMYQDTMMIRKMRKLINMRKNQSQ